MWSDLLLDLLLASLMIALSPITIISITLVLSTPRGRANGLAFTGGWLAGLVALTAVFVFLTDTAQEEVAGANTALYIFKAVAGVLLLALAVRKFMKRPAAGEEPKLPGWMSAIDTVEPSRAVALGGLLALANPKHWAFALIAATSIGQSGVTGNDEWAAVLVFVLLSSLTVLGAVACAMIAGERAGAVLARLKDFMARNNAVIMAALFAFFGVKLVISGLGALIA